MEIKPKPIKYDIRDLKYANQDWPPVQYLIEELIRQKSINLIYGNGGMGKTYILLDLALCVAAGRPEWMGYKIPRPVPVLYVNAEMEEQDFSMRVGEVYRGELIPPEANFHFINSAEFIFENPQTEIEITKLVQEYRIELLVIDALSDILGGRNNGADEVQPFFRFLKRLRKETGVTNLIVHHNNRNGTYLGSVDIRNQCDNFVELQGKEITFVWKGDKSRFSNNIIFSGIKNWEHNSFFLSKTKDADDKLSDRLRSILETIPEIGVVTIKDISKSLKKTKHNIAQSTLYREIQKLDELGYLYVANPEEMGRGMEKMYGKTELSVCDEIMATFKEV